jgi:hypothetical protein
MALEKGAACLPGMTWCAHTAAVLVYVGVCGQQPLLGKQRPGEIHRVGVSCTGPTTLHSRAVCGGLRLLQPGWAGRRSTPAAQGVSSQLRECEPAAVWDCMCLSAPGRALRVSTGPGTGYV